MQMSGAGVASSITFTTITISKGTRSSSCGANGPGDGGLVRVFGVCEDLEPFWHGRCWCAGTLGGTGTFDVLQLGWTGCSGFGHAPSCWTDRLYGYLPWALGDDAQGQTIRTLVEPPQ
jgi:hypothetical protein